MADQPDALFDSYWFERDLTAQLRGGAVAVRIADRFDGLKCRQPNPYDVLFWTATGEHWFMSAEDFSVVHQCDPNGQMTMFPTGVHRDHDDADAVSMRIINLILGEPELASA